MGLCKQQARASCTMACDLDHSSDRLIWNNQRFSGKCIIELMAFLDACRSVRRP